MMRRVGILALGVLLGVGGMLAYRQLTAAPANKVEASAGGPQAAAGTRSGAGATPSAKPASSSGGAAGASTGEPVLPVASFAEAELRPLRSAELAFPVSGVVSERLVQVGDRVEASAPLMRLDSSEQSTLLRQAEAALSGEALCSKKAKHSPFNVDGVDVAVAEVEDGVVVTTIDRETTGGLRATVDDYVVNLDVARRTVQHAGRHESTTNGDTTQP